MKYAIALLGTAFLLGGVRLAGLVAADITLLTGSVPLAVLGAAMAFALPLAIYVLTVWLYIEGMTAGTKHDR